MRVYLLPISTRRTLLYAQRLNIATTTKNAGYVDKAVGYAARKWAEWETKDAGWQRKVVDYGNHALRRIPYEEWGLKSVPPLYARRRDEELKGKEKIQLVFPRRIIPVHKAESVARTLATERESLHIKRLTWSVLAMPLTIPVGLLPVIPNIPFFYLVYRAWSHWRAIMGGKHIQWLIKHRLLVEAPSETVDGLYGEDAPSLDDSSDGKEKMLLSQKQVQGFCKSLEVPALAIELERAIWQVENAIKGKESTETTKDATTTKSDDDASKEDKKGQ